MRYYYFRPMMCEIFVSIKQYTVETITLAAEINYLSLQRKLSLFSDVNKEIHFKYTITYLIYLHRIYNIPN